MKSLLRWKIKKALYTLSV